MQLMKQIFGYVWRVLNGVSNISVKNCVVILSDFHLLQFSVIYLGHLVN